MGGADSSLRPWRFAWPITGSSPAIWSGPMSMWQCVVWRVPARAPTPCTTVCPPSVFRSGVVAGPGLPGSLSVTRPDVVPTSSDVLVRSAFPQHRAPCWEVCQELAFCSSFCGCSSSILESPDHENSRRKSSFATAILLRRWRVRRLVRKPTTPSVDPHSHRTANNVVNMAASLAPSNLRRDSKAPGRAYIGPIL